MGTAAASAHSWEALSLDDERALSAVLVGAKAARLAAARRRGLPVLPGVVVSPGPAREGIAAAEATLSVGGERNAEQSVMAALTLAFDVAPYRAERWFDDLGPRLVVRSSGVDEDDPAWAGAFSSFVDVAPSELATAFAGCWASALRPQVLARLASTGRSAAQACPAVLVQPFVEAGYAGVATTYPADEVEIFAVRGSPASLLGGYMPGSVAIESGGTVKGSAVTLLGEERTRAVASLARQASEGGPVTIEWAEHGGQLALLQVRSAAPLRARPPSEDLPSGERPLVSAPFPHGQGQLGLHRTGRARCGSARALGLAEVLARYGGLLGDCFVLPWHIGLDPVEIDSAALGLGARRRTAAADPLAALEQATALADCLSEHSHLPRPALSELAAGAVCYCEVPPLADSARRDGALLMALLAGIGDALVSAGKLAHSSQLWALSPAAVEASLRGGAAPGWQGHRWRTRRWQELMCTLVVAHGNSANGEGVAPGRATGLMRWVRTPRDLARVAPAEVVVIPYPLPQMAPLLFVASGLIAQGGSGAAHLVEVARSQRVPTVVATGDLEKLLADGDLVCADGDTGSVSFAARGARAPSGRVPRGI